MRFTPLVSSGEFGEKFKAAITDFLFFFLLAGGQMKHLRSAFLSPQFYQLFFVTSTPHTLEEWEQTVNTTLLYYHLLGLKQLMLAFLQIQPRVQVLLQLWGAIYEIWGPGVLPLKTVHQRLISCILVIVYAPICVIVEMSSISSTPMDSEVTAQHQRWCFWSPDKWQCNIHSILALFGLYQLLRKTSGFQLLNVPLATNFVCCVVLERFFTVGWQSLYSKNRCLLQLKTTR